MAQADGTVSHIPHFESGRKEDGLAGLTRCLSFDESGKGCYDDAEVWITSDGHGIYPVCKYHWLSTSSSFQKVWDRVYYDRDEIMIIRVMST